MSNSFGRSLRDARRRAGLTQVELGGGKISGSYVSLIESGSRQPTPAMIEHFAEALSLDPSEVTSWHQAEAAAQAEDAVTLSVVRSVMDNREFSTVEHLATIASARALSAGNFTLFWELNALRIEAARTRGDYALCRDLARELLHQDFVVQSARLQSWALAYLSAGLRETGEMDEAVATARQSWELVQDLLAEDENASVSGEMNLALLSYTAAVTEADRTDDMRELCTWLEDMIARMEGDERHEVGELSWALGNLYFSMGDIQRAVESHDRALEELRTHRASLDNRFRLLRSTVSQRLAAKELSETTGKLVQTLRQVALWVEGEDSFLADHVTATWLVSTGQVGEAQSSLRRLARPTGQARPLQRAQAMELSAHHLHDTDPVELVQMMAEAARLYSEAGDEEGMRRALAATAQVGTRP